MSTGVEPAHWNYNTGTTCFSYGKDGQCTQSMQNPPRWVDDRCYVHIRDTEHDGKEGDIQVPCDKLADYRPGQYVKVVG